MKTRGIGLIGGGAIADVHLSSLKEIGHAKLVAICDLVEEKAKKAAEKYGCSATTDPAQLLKNPEVEIVHVVTPSGSHGKLAIQALEAGKHVLVEKPMAMTVAECDRMIALAGEKKRVLGIVSQRRFEEQHQAVKKILDEGKLGRLLLAEVICPYYRTQAYYDSADWRGTIAQDGGALMNQAVHSVDLFLWMMGPARSVFGKCATQIHKMEAEDLALAVVTFVSGALGTIMASTNIRPGFQPALNLYGEKGTIKLEAATVTHWTVPDVPQPDFGQATASTGVADPKLASNLHHKMQILDFLGAVEEGRQPLVDAHAGRRAVELVQGAYASSAKGQPMELSGK